MISKNAHRILDYVSAAVLMASPYLFGMENIGNAKEVFFCAGLITFANAFISVFSTKLHMNFDLLIGTFLITAPSIFSYKLLLSSAQYEVHIIEGFLFILFVGETQYRHQGSIAGPKIILH